jgi:hypothetical protein
MAAAAGRRVHPGSPQGRSLEDRTAGAGTHAGAEPRFDRDSRHRVSAVTLRAGDGLQFFVIGHNI